MTTSDPGSGLPPAAIRVARVLAARGCRLLGTLRGPDGVVSLVVEDSDRLVIVEVRESTD